MSTYDTVHVLEHSNSPTVTRRDSRVEEITIRYDQIESDQIRSNRIR